MSLRKQIIIFCGSSGSSNHDNYDRLGPNRSQVEAYLKLNNKKHEIEVQRIKNLLRFEKNPIIQRSSEIISDMKMASSNPWSEPYKYLSTKASETQIKEQEGEGLHILQIFNASRRRLDDLVTQKSEVLDSLTLDQMAAQLGQCYEVETVSDVVSVSDFE